MRSRKLGSPQAGSLSLQVDVTAPKILKRPTFREVTMSQNSPPDIRIGELPETFGPYLIEKRLGQGGMGTVYCAVDTKLKRQVALKVCHLADDDNTLVRFQREAQAMAALRHPNLCPVHDFDIIDGVPYFTMALITGPTLDRWVQERSGCTPREAAILVSKIALALQYGHEHGVIHRDLKPTNIMMDGREPVVVDFGLARFEQSSDPKVTRAGAVIGTPSYMSPEQVEGNQQAIGPSTDVYSLGVVLYELLTGRVPFQGAPTPVMAQILVNEPSTPLSLCPDLDPKLAAICLKALRKRPDERWASMKEFATALVTLVREQSHPFEPVRKSDGPALLDIPKGGADTVVQRSLVTATEQPQRRARKRASHTTDNLLHSQRVRLALLASAATFAIACCISAVLTFGIRSKDVRDIKQEASLVVGTVAPPSLPNQPTTQVRPSPSTAINLMTRGTEWRAKKNIDKAIECFSEAIRADPTSAVAYTKRADALIEKKDYLAAIGDCDTAIKLEPKLALPYAVRGYALVCSGKPDEGIRDCDEATRLDDKYWVAYNARGHAYAGKKDYNRAIAEFSTAIRLNASAFNYVSRASLYILTNSYDLALVDCQKAILIDPENAMAYNNRGCVWGRKGDFDKALRDFNEAIRLDPSCELAVQNRRKALADKASK